MNELINFRDASLKDALGISKAHVKSWQETYNGIVPDSYLQSLDPNSRAKMWADRFQDPLYDGKVIVAHAELGIVGFVGLGPSRSPVYPSWGELRAIYLLQSHKGTGVGRKLFELGKQRLQSLGYTEFFCWVLKENSTRGFYEKVDGSLSNHEKTIQIGGKDLVDVAYEWHIQLINKQAGTITNRNC